MMEKKYWVLLGVATLGIGAIVWYLYDTEKIFKKNRDKLELTKVDENSFDGVIKIVVPLTNSQFYNNIESVANKKVMDVIKSKYKTIIDKIAKISLIPSSIITSLIFIESRGDESVVSSSGAVGLMQISPKGITDIVIIERKKKNLTELEKAILKKYLTPQEYKDILNMDMGQIAITKERGIILLKKPEFNILIGSMYFGQCLDKTKENNKYRLDKAIVLYNRGYYSKILTGDIATLLKSDMPTESKDYIKKFVGKLGTLDTIV